MAEDDDAPEEPPDSVAVIDSPSQAKEPVGYGNPPRHNRFRKGQSGNPKGRPRGSKNLSTLVDEELKQTVTVTENGARKRISKAQAIAKRLVNGAVAGETKMVPMLLNQERAQADQQASVAAAEMPIGAEDELVIEQIIERIRNAQPLPTTDQAGAEEGQTISPVAPPDRGNGRGQV